MEEPVLCCISLLSKAASDYTILLCIPTPDHWFFVVMSSILVLYTDRRDSIFFFITLESFSLLHDARNHNKYLRHYTEFVHMSERFGFTVMSSFACSCV